MRYRPLIVRTLCVASLMLAALAVAACMRTPSGLERSSITHDGLHRSYLLFVPEMAAEPMPLVLALHRFTGSGAEMARTSRFHEVAAEEGFVVVFPDGRGRRWNTESDASPDDVGFLLALVDALSEELPIDPRRVYVTGASNGGFLTWLLACQASERFAAVAPVMATFPEEIADACGNGPMPVCIVHGTADPVVPYDESELQGGPGSMRRVLPIPEAIAFWVERNGANPEPEITVLPDLDPNDGTTTTVERYTNPGGAEVLHYRVEGGGHTWPGGTEIWPRFIVGNQSQDFSASRAIWAFFEANVLPE